MLRLKETDSTFISEEHAGFAKRLVEDGLLPRQVDLLLLGFSHAVQNGLRPLEKVKRHDLVRAGGIDESSRMVFEAVAAWYARRLGQEEPKDAKALLDFICRLGSTGVGALKQEWEGKSKSQIRLSIVKLPKRSERSYE